MQEAAKKVVNSIQCKLFSFERKYFVHGLRGNV